VVRSKEVFVFAVEPTIRHNQDETWNPGPGFSKGG